MQAQLHASWDVRSGLEEDYVEWIKTVHVPFWREQPGFLAVRGFYMVVGAGPAIVGEFDFETLEDLQNTLNSPAYRDILNALRAFVTHYESKILVSTGRGDTYVLPADHTPREGKTSCTP